MLVLYVLKMTPRTLAIMSLTSLATNNLIAIRRRGGSTLDLIWATINLCPQVVLNYVSFIHLFQISQPVFGKGKKRRICMYHLHIVVAVKQRLAGN